MVGLLEIKVKESNVKKCLNIVVKGWGFLNNYFEVVKGRFWIVWNFFEFDVDFIKNLCIMYLL